MVVVNKQRHRIPGHWEVQVLSRTSPKAGSRLKLEDGSTVEVRGAVMLSPKWQQLAKPPKIKGYKKPPLLYSLVCATTSDGKEESKHAQWVKQTEDKRQERADAHLAEFIARAKTSAEEQAEQRAKEEEEKRKKQIRVGDLNYD